MPSIYSNITRLQASELAVSRGTVDYNKTILITEQGDFALSTLTTPNNIYVNSSAIIPDQGFQPRGAVESTHPSLGFNMVNNAYSSYTLNTNNPTTAYENGFVAPVYEGVTRIGDVNDLVGSDLPIAYSVFKQYEPYVGNWKIPYSSKVIPIFATGGPEQQSDGSGNNYSLMPLLDFDLLYVKCNILRGEVSSVCNVPSGFTYNSPEVIEKMTEDVMYQYPLYNAIEIMIATKNTLPAGEGFLNQHGGCWLRKTFLISWKLKEFTETPFPNITSNTISRKYWYPTGLLPANDTGTSVDLSWERYGNYFYDALAYNPNTNDAFYVPDSTWLRDWGLPPSSFYNNENPISITENDDEKKATIKINAITRKGYDSLNHRGYVAKGLAKII